MLDVGILEVLSNKWLPVWQLAVQKASGIYIRSRLSCHISRSPNNINSQEHGFYM